MVCAALSKCIVEKRVSAPLRGPHSVIAVSYLQSGAVIVHEEKGKVSATLRGPHNFASVLYL